MAAIQGVLKEMSESMLLSTFYQDHARGAINLIENLQAQSKRLDAENTDLVNRLSLRDEKIYAEIGRLNKEVEIREEVVDSLSKSVSEKSIAICEKCDRIRELEAEAINRKADHAILARDYSEMRSERNAQLTNALLANNAKEQAHLDLANARNAEAKTNDDLQKSLAKIQELYAAMAALRKVVWDETAEPPKDLTPLSGMSDRIARLEKDVALIKNAKIAFKKDQTCGWLVLGT